MNIMYRITLRSLRENKTRTLVTIIGVILSAAMVTAVTSFASSMQNYLLEYAISENGDWHAKTDLNSYEDFEKISKDERLEEVSIVRDGGYAHMKNVSVVRDGEYVFIQDGTNEYKPYLSIMELDRQAFHTLPIHLTEGRLPANSNEVVLSDHISSNGGVVYKIGDTIGLEVGNRISDGFILDKNIPFHHEQDGNHEELQVNGNKTFTVVGVCERFPYVIEGYSDPGYSIFTTLDESKLSTQPLEMENNAENSSISIFMKFTRPLKVFDIEQEFINQYNINGFKYNDDVLSATGISNISGFNIVIYGISSIVLILIMIGSISLIYNSFSISISERTKQFGLLTSVGATNKQLMNSVLFEAFFIAVVGIPIGIGSGIIGIGTTLYFLKDNFASMFTERIPVELTLHVSVPSIIAAIILSLITILISNYIPARRSKKVSALDAIRQTSDTKLTPKAVKTTRLTRKMFGISGDLALKNLKRNKKRYRSTVISLFISVLLFISASAVSMYLTDTVENALQTVNYDLEYTIYENESLGSQHRKAYEDILNQDSITNGSILKLDYGTSFLKKEQLEASHYSSYIESGLINDGDDMPVEILLYSIDHDTFIKYIDELSLSKEKYQNPNELTAIVIDKQHYFNNEQERYINSKIFKEQTETTIAVVSENNETSIPVVLGAHATTSPLGVPEYSATGRLIMIFDANVVEDYITEHTQYNISDFYQNQTYYMYFNSKSSKDSVNEIKNIFTEANLPYNGIYDSYEQEKTMRNIITIINVFAYGFNVLMSLITIANVFNTISTNINLRRREFAMIKSVGMTNHGFNKMLNYECVFYGLKALLYGLPVSILVTYLIYITFQYGVESNFYLPIKSILLSVFSVFIVVFVSMMYSMRKIRNKNIVDALRNENL